MQNRQCMLKVDAKKQMLNTVYQNTRAKNAKEM